MSAATAERLYERLHSIGVEELGNCPIYSVDPLVHSAYRKYMGAVRNRFGADLDQLLADRSTTVHSPWEAALVLTLLETRTKLFPELDARDLDDDLIDEIGTEPVFVYRGQPSLEYHPPTPSIDRRSDPERRIAENRGELFGGVLARLWESIDFIAPTNEFPDAHGRGFRAIARHYGVANHLLDFSTDPRPAVSFADNSEKYDTGETGVVYALQIREVFDHFGEDAVDVILPHPISRRIYRQRGVFLDTSEVDYEALEPFYYEVRFPIQHSFDVLRLGTPVPLLQAEEWLSKLAEWSDSKANDGVALPASDEDRVDLFRDFFSTHGYPDWDARSGVEHVRLAEKVVDLLYSFVFRYLPEIDQELIDCHLLRQIVETNPLVVEWLAHYWLMVGKREGNETKIRYAIGIYRLLPAGARGGIALDFEGSLADTPFDLDGPAPC
jgi:hypothetical protein